MFRAIVVIVGVMVSCTSYAIESCAVQAARLISQGKTAELSGRFIVPGPEVARGLATLADELGSMGEVSPLPQPSAGKSVRKSVAIPGLPARISFDGSWAAATTRRGERIEFQASSEPGSDCRLLALHVHVFRK